MVGLLIRYLTEKVKRDLSSHSYCKIAKLTVQILVKLQPILSAVWVIFYIHINICSLSLSIKIILFFYFFPTIKTSEQVWTQFYNLLCLNFLIELYNVIKNKNYNYLENLKYREETDHTFVFSFKSYFRTGYSLHKSKTAFFYVINIYKCLKVLRLTTKEIVVLVNILQVQKQKL